MDLKGKLILSKRDIAEATGCASPSGRVYSEKLREKVFTDELLEAIGMDADEYRRVKTFTLCQSKKIKTYIYGSNDNPQLARPAVYKRNE